jgi:dephospho-CoA kinase
MIIVGLTGGIATGKSTVATIFAELGAYRIDADRLARDVVKPGQPAMQAIMNYFGKDIVNENGQLNRKKLADIIFADPVKRNVLNEMTHPPIRALLRDELAQARKKGACVALVEVPLLYEGGFDRDVDVVVVVSVRATTQLSRLMTRENLNEQEAQLRVSAQMPLAEKVARADFVVNNDGDHDHARQQVNEIWQQLRRECTND